MRQNHNLAANRNRNRMHYWTNQHFLRRILLIMDLAAGILGFGLALVCRFLIRGLVWNVGAYSTLLILSILLCISLNLFRRVRHRLCRIMELDAVELASELVRDRVVQYVITVLLLYFMRTIDEISRLVILLMLLFDLGISYVSRLLLQSRLLRAREESPADENYVILTTGQNMHIARMRLQETFSDKAEISGTICLTFSNDRPVNEQVRIALLACCEESDRCAATTDDSDSDSTIFYEDVSLSRGKRLFVYFNNAQGREAEDAAIVFCREHDIPVRVFRFANDLELPGAMVGSTSPYVTLDFEPLCKEGEVFGVFFAPTNTETAVFEVMDRRDSLSGQYLCFSNVHTTVMAHNDAAYRDILNGSAFTFADGRPIAKRLYNNGFLKSQRVAGPDFMDALFRATMDGRVSHYFYGSTPETIEQLLRKLPERYPGIRIAGAVSPPFRPETEEEDAASVAAMNDSGANFIWVGLGAPKQERWMAAHMGRLNGVMLGVGAGFDFYAGTVRRAPKWMQKIGLEWLYRLFQDPKRLANRYIVTNVQYLWYSLTERLSGSR